MRCEVHDLGLREYGAAWSLQEEYARDIAAGSRPATLLLVEHPHVYTFGSQGHRENLILNPQELKDRGLAVHWVDRGGDVTYHGPGQLVGYPLIPLGAVSTAEPSEAVEAGTSMHIPRADYVGYVRNLEKTLIVALARLGIAAAQVPGLTGVWIQADVHSRCIRCRPEDRRKPAKIAAIGVRIDARGISRHGFALNVQPDMTYWDGIVACGLADHPLAGLGDLLSDVPSMDLVKQHVARAFGEVFGFSMSWMDSRTEP